MLFKNNKLTIDLKFVYLKKKCLFAVIFFQAYFCILINVYSHLKLFSILPLLVFIKVIYP